MNGLRSMRFGSAFVVMAALTGCITDGEDAPLPVGDASMDTDRAEAIAQLTALAQAPAVTRSEEGGVTVIRGTAPPQLLAMTSTVPVSNTQQAAAIAAEVDVPPGPATGGSLVAAALGGAPGERMAAAPGALASRDQLAALASPEQLAGLPAQMADIAALAPAAGGAADSIADDSDPIVAQIRERAAMAPTSIAQLEARGATRMSTDAIAAITVGNTLTHTNADNGFSIATYYDPSGESRLINDGRGLPARYQISDGARCRIDSQGIGVCALLYSEGDTTWVCDQRDQGVCNWYVSQVQPGYIRG